MDFCRSPPSISVCLPPNVPSNEDFVLWGAAEGRGPAAAGRLQKGMMGGFQETNVMNVSVFSEGWTQDEFDLRRFKIPPTCWVTDAARASHDLC